MEISPLLEKKVCLRKHHRKNVVVKKRHCNKSHRKTSKTVFEGKQMILVIAPFIAITLFLHVQMINQIKKSENLQTYIQTY